MSTPLDPTFLKKIQGSGFMPFKDRVGASLASGRPPPKPVPISIEAQRISRMNLELLEDNVAADEKIASLETQIEQGRVVLAHKHARICTLKGQLDSSRTQCASLESQLGEQTKNAEGYKLRIKGLEKELGDARTNITALEAEVIDKEADVEVLRNHKDMMYAVETELLTALRDDCLELDAVRKDHAWEIARMKGRLIEMKDSKEQVEKALGEESARLAGVQAELKDTKEKLQVEQGRAKELRDANEALGGEIAELKWTLEEKEYELGQAKEKIAELESNLKNTEEKLSDAQYTILKDRGEFAQVKDAHDAVQALLTDQCSDLTISLKHANNEIADIKSQLEVAEGQLIDIEEFVCEQEAEIQQKDEEIAGLRKQVVDEREHARADIEVKDGEIAELQNELGGTQMALEETRNGWKQESDDLKERLGDAEGKLQGLRDDFGAFEEEARVKEVSLEGRIATLANEVLVKDGALAERDNKIDDLTIEANAQEATIQTTIVALLEMNRSRRDQRAAGLAELQAVREDFGVFREVAQANETELEGRIRSLEDDVKVKDAELDVVHSKVKELENIISSLITEANAKDSIIQNTIVASIFAARSAEQQQKAGLAREAVLESKVEEFTNGLRDKDKELEITRTRLEASDNKIAELNIQLEKSSGRSEDLCALNEDKNRAIEESHDGIGQLKARILELESRLATPHTLEVTTTAPLDIDDAPPSDSVPVCDILQINRGNPAQAPVATPGPQLQATAPTFTPSLGQPSGDTPQLRPSAPSFVPCSSVVGSTPLRPDVPSFTPRQPPIRVAQLCASAAESVTRPRGQPVVNTPMSPITFVPRQGLPHPPFIPTTVHTPPVGPYPSPPPSIRPRRLPALPFVPPAMTFIPNFSYSTHNPTYWTPPVRENTYGAVRMDTDVRAGDAGVFSPMNAQVGCQGPTGPSPLAHPITELSITSIPSTDRNKASL
ncbi:hypothetical protein NLI96_g11781 [Meripilus lineatus]|uniref:Uncharacterized protein n=1 Tax=Meripilus lineatus TaxID=2056292 RepID=A0AAD5UR55_9APHY|nr:hypothetical protein NLI96_g11781 [Physisporinus lineatus]